MTVLWFAGVLAISLSARRAAPLRYFTHLTTLWTLLAYPLEPLYSLARENIFPNKHRFAYRSVLPTTAVDIYTGKKKEQYEKSSECFHYFCFARSILFLDFFFKNVSGVERLGNAYDLCFMQCICKRKVNLTKC